MKYTSQKPQYYRLQLFKSVVAVHPSHDVWRPVQGPTSLNSIWAALLDVNIYVVVYIMTVT
jgi:hypothetical protein